MSLSKLSLDALPDAEAALTDRDRLALALGILREQGWFAPIDWCAIVCCSTHGFTQMCEHFGMSPEQWMETEWDDEPPAIWWHQQTDSIAFLGVARDEIMSREMEEKVDAAYAEFGDDDDRMTAWLLEHDAEINADEVVERTTKLVNLVDTLMIHWSGGMEKMAEAVAVLRSVGLIVTEPLSPLDRIQVHPSSSGIHVERHEGDALSLWFGARERVETKMPDIVLSRRSAEDLIALLQAALLVVPQQTTE